MTTAKPEIKEGRGFNAIWVIPAVAALLGIYLVVHNLMTEGPEITIAFETASGLTAGKTKIKYRDVDMGLVTEVNLTDDFKGVIATVKMDLQAKPLLTPDTRFWVVTARVGLGDISGLDTLVSGAYVQMAPGAAGGPVARSFEALPRPPLTAADAPGIRLHLLSNHGGSVSTGDSVLYKGYQVGRVEHSEFDAGLERMRYEIFIDAPYDELVDSSVRFFNTSGISLKAGADGVKLMTGSLDTLLLGGVAFQRPPDLEKGLPVESGAEFELFDSYETSLENPFSHGSHVVVRFSGSLKGLMPGAPVEYRGIRIGRVERLMLKDLIDAELREAGNNETLQSTGEAIPVLLYLEPGRLSLPDTETTAQNFLATLATGVGNGMRATLETGNLLTGAKYVGIEFYPNLDETLEAGQWGEYLEIPSIEGGFGQILVKVNSILEKIDQAPLEETLLSVNTAVAQLNRSLAGLDTIVNSENTQQLPEDLSRSLAELQRTLEGLSPNSELYENTNRSIRQLNRTLDNLESLTRTLSRQPNAAVTGSKLPEDPIPKAKP